MGVRGEQGGSGWVWRGGNIGGNPFFGAAITKLKR